MSYKYIGIPTSVSFDECKQNDSVFAPSKYTRFLPSNKDLYVPLSELCTERKEKNKVKKSDKYLYSEIGDIDVSNGTVLFREEYGLTLPSESPKICKPNDILISTVRTYRGGFGMLTSDKDNHCCSPAIIVVKDVDQRITKEYLLAVLRTDFFIEQILGFQTRGMYPRLDSNAMDKVIIPVPKDANIIKYVSVMMRACLNKYELIKKRYTQIQKLIDEELKSNQNSVTFDYKLPTIQDIEEAGRIDTGLYSSIFKEYIHLIKNYKYGFHENIFSMGYKLSRGQNLQESNIGKSIYSDHHYKNFYTVALPTNFSEYGTINKVIYLGNRNKLKTLSNGEIIFGAEATFRGFVVCDAKDNYITNIHGVTISNNNNISQSIFVKSFLDYLVKAQVIDCVKVGGHGGSFAQKYWSIIPFPKFPEATIKEIAALYHKPQDYNTGDCTIDTFLDFDNQYNASAGIYELDKTAKHLLEILNDTIDKIVKEQSIDLVF